MKFVLMHNFGYLAKNPSQVYKKKKKKILALKSLKQIYNCPSKPKIKNPKTLELAKREITVTTLSDKFSREICCSTFDDDEF